MKKALQRRPFFLFLFPVFFVFHGFVENWRFIRFTDCLPLIAAYWAGAAVLYLLFYAFLRNSIKAAMAAAFVMAFYFFFGYLHDFLQRHSIFLHRYGFLLSAFLALTVLLTLYLRKKAPFNRLSLFLTVLFLLYIPVDGMVWAWNAAGKAPAAAIIHAFGNGQYGKCDSCARPDIYLLLFDEYAGNRELRDVFNYDNSGLESFLTAEGFHLQQKSRSNYAFTVYSMASMLNCSYLRDIAHPTALDAEDLLNTLEPIRKNDVVNFLVSQGYSIVNNSPFDLPEHPALNDQPFIAVKTKLITFRTLTDYVVRDLGPWLNDRLHTPQALPENVIDQNYRINEAALSRTMEESRRRSDSPRFIYAHVLLPHFPFIFDSLSHRRSEQEIDSTDDPRHYLAYLPYTNSRIRQLITTIKKNTGGKAVILFMSDHGYRYSPDGKDRPYFFYNQNAVYFPDKDYSPLYDSISNVNQFRVVFNKLFRLNLPLLKDSTIFLQYIGNNQSINR